MLHDDYSGEVESVPHAPMVFSCGDYLGHTVTIWVRDKSKIVVMHMDDRYQRYQVCFGNSRNQVQSDKLVLEK